MTHGKNRPRILGLTFLVALGVMVFGAAGAQAQGDWYESGVEIAAKKNISVQQGSEPEGSLLVASKLFEIKCGQFKTLSAQIWPLSSGKGAKKGGALGHAVFDIEACKFWILSTLALSSKCTIGILPATMLLEVVGAGVVLAYPLKAGEPLAQMVFGELCPVLAGEEIGLGGSVLVNTGGKALTSKAIEGVQKFLVSVVTDEEHKLPLGLNTTTVDITAFAGLESGNTLGIG